MHGLHGDPCLDGITLYRAYHHLSVNLYTCKGLEIATQGLSTQDDIFCTIDNLTHTIVGSKAVNGTPVRELEL